MQEFKNIEDIYAEALESLKQNFKNGKISIKEAKKQAQKCIKEIKELLPAMDIIYPYNVVRKVENLAIKFADFLSEIQTNQNSL